MYYCGLWITKEESVAVVVWDNGKQENLRFNFTCDERGLKTLINNLCSHGIMQSNLITGLKFYYTGEEWSDDYQRIYYVWYFLKSYGFDIRFINPKEKERVENIKLIKRNVYEKYNEALKIAEFIRKNNLESSNFCDDKFNLKLEFDKNNFFMIFILLHFTFFLLLTLSMSFEVLIEIIMIIFMVFFYIPFIISLFKKRKTKKEYLHLSLFEIKKYELNNIFENSIIIVKWNEIKSVKLKYGTRGSPNIIVINSNIKINCNDVPLLTEDFYNIVKFYWTNFGWYDKK